MNSMNKDITAALVGSLPRNKQVLQARRKWQTGMIAFADYQEEVYKQTAAVVEMQETLGLDLIVSGEIGRDNYVSFIADKIGGVKEMSQAEMIDYIEDKQAFEKQLSILDVPAQSIKNAICIGKLSYKNPIVADELTLLKKLTAKKVKITLPGPYLVTRSMWLYELSKTGYDSKEALGEDVIRLFSQEIETLQTIGVDEIQFDEPVLTEVVFTEGRPRSFMCASLSQKKDPTEELIFARHLIHSVMKKVDRSKSTRSLHVCRGNWSKNESILLTGPYTPLIELFSAIDADKLVLEFSTPRAGELETFLSDKRIHGRIALGLGVLNPRSDAIESTDSIVALAKKALKYIDKKNLQLNPDCGFATFANKPVNTYDNIKLKIGNMIQARDILQSL